jgi:hypothetical protein
VEVDNESDVGKWKLADAKITATTILDIHAKKPGTDVPGFFAGSLPRATETILV